MVQLSELTPGTYYLAGNDVCDSGYQYSSDDIKIILKNDGTLSGRINYSSCDEDDEVCTMEGTWEKSGRIAFSLTYSNMTFICEGGSREHIFGGAFRICDVESYSQAANNLRGKFRYVQIGFEDDENIMSKFAL